MLILSNIFVELEHLIIFINVDIKVPQLHLLQDRHKINGSKAVHVNM